MNKLTSVTALKSRLLALRVSLQAAHAVDRAMDSTHDNFMSWLWHDSTTDSAEYCALLSDLDAVHHIKSQMDSTTPDFHAWLLS